MARVIENIWYIWGPAGFWSWGCRRGALIALKEILRGRHGSLEKWGLSGGENMEGEMSS